MVISKDIIRINPGISFEDAQYWLNRVPVKTLCKTPTHVWIKIHDDGVYDEWITNDLEYPVGIRRLAPILMKYGAVLLRPKVKP